MKAQSVQREAMPSGCFTQGLAVFRALAICAVFGGKFVDQFNAQRRLLEAQRKLLDSLQHGVRAQGHFQLALADRVELDLEWHAKFIRLACVHFAALERSGWLAEAALAADRRELLDSLARLETFSERLQAKHAEVRARLEEIDRLGADAAGKENT